MALDLRDVLREEMRVHPRLVQQGLFGRVDARARIAAAIPPLVPFGDSEYAGALWVIDWDHRLPSRHAALRLYAYYTAEGRRELDEACAARERAISAEDLFPEFDVSDFAAGHRHRAGLDALPRAARGRPHPGAGPRRSRTDRMVAAMRERPCPLGSRRLVPADVQ